MYKGTLKNDDIVSDGVGLIEDSKIRKERERETIDSLKNESYRTTTK